MFAGAVQCHFRERTGGCNDRQLQQLVHESVYISSVDGFSGLYGEHVLRRLHFDHLCLRPRTRDARAARRRPRRDRIRAAAQVELNRAAGQLKGEHVAYDVEVGAPAQLYARTLPAGATAVGIVRKETGETGALLRFKNGAYAQMNGSLIRPLNRREVLRAMLDGVGHASPRAR